MSQQTFETYEEFWPYYVAMHSRAATRWVHLTGTLTGLAISAYGLARGRKRYLAALPLIGYGTAWPVLSKYRTKDTRQRKEPRLPGGLGDGARGLKRRRRLSTSPPPLPRSAP
ncbi:Mpo1-like protein [Streptomyces griseus]|uniref:Mpo1-like protein n=1 Tax=Streptomyces griseus TaxID=1911 RepID=UPI0037BA589B